MSATPGPFELEHSAVIAEQIIRPTGLVEPEVEVRPITGQIDDLISEIRDRAEKNERTLITTLTKKMAEDLTEYLTEHGVRVRYMHSDIDTLERIEIIRDLRLGRFDALIGINLLREGLDIPEVSLVAVLDADKEGFLRSSTSLIQTIGRAARNASGKVILYADSITKSMRSAIDETARRRKIQTDYNEKHNIKPQTVNKAVKDILNMISSGSTVTDGSSSDQSSKKISAEDIPGLQKSISDTEKQMLKAAEDMEFEIAAALRDQMYDLKRKLSQILDSMPVGAVLELSETENIKSKKLRKRRSKDKKQEIINL